MNPCMAKRGIFTLQPCGQPASSVCAACQVPLCPEHLFMIGLRGFCARCHAAQGSGDGPSDVDWQQPGWSQRWRDDYHQRSRYRPFYSSYGGTTFDDGDYAAFDNQAPPADIAADDDGAGFSDS